MVRKQFSAPFHVKVLGGGKLVAAAASAISKGDSELREAIIKNCTTTLAFLRPKASAIALFVTFSLLTGFVFTIVSLIVFAVIRRRVTDEIDMRRRGYAFDRSNGLLVFILEAVLSAKKNVPAKSDTKSLADIMLMAQDICYLDDNSAARFAMGALMYKTKAKLDLLGIVNCELGDAVEDEKRGFKLTAHHFILMKLCDLVHEVGGVDSTLCACKGNDDVVDALDRLRDNNELKFAGEPPAAELWNSTISWIAANGKKFFDLLESFDPEQDKGEASMLEKKKKFIEDLRSFLTSNE
jgi:hypothetical protein